MKNVFATLLSLFIITSSSAFAGGIGDYSSGKRIGMITKFSEKGLFVKSGEGQMLMGSDSTPYVITSTDSDGNETRTTINPWYFSSTNDVIKNKLRSLVGEYAVLSYSQHTIKGFDVDTSYEITGIQDIGEPMTSSCISNSDAGGSHSDGTRVGRIVKLSMKGAFIDTAEMLIQQGFSGNQFKAMSLDLHDKEFYDCAMKFLESGTKAKFYYTESFINTNFLGQKTNYIVNKIEVLKSGLN